MAGDNPFYVGMSREEVRNRLGVPVAIVEAASGGVEVWRYRAARQPWLRVRTRWLEFRFRDGGLLPGEFARTESVPEAAARYGRRLAGLTLVYAIILAGLALDQRAEHARLATARETLRPGMTMREVAHVLGRSLRGETGSQTITWVISERAEPLAPFVDVYLVRGRLVRGKPAGARGIAIEFKNGEFVRWTEDRG